MKKYLIIYPIGLILFLSVFSLFIFLDFKLDGLAKSDGLAKLNIISQCKDSDGGDSPFVKGRVSYKLMFWTRSYEDKCVNKNQLREYYCEKNNRKLKIHKCENGCQDGACVRQLTGTKPLKLLVVEFAPQDIKYGKLYYCYNNLLGYYFQDLEEYCDNKIEEHSFLEITNNPQKQFRFENLREVDRLNNPHSLFYLNDYLKKEASRYGITKIPYFNIEIKGPFSLSEFPPKTTFDYGNVDDFFINKVKELNIDTSNYDFVVVIYFNDYDLLSNIDRHKFVNHVGDWIFISLDTYRETEDHGVDILIHELLHKFGATDKYIFGESDPNDWCYLFECCLDPDGIPEPNKVPKYPQTKGCIMCAGGIIAIQYGKESQAPGSLDRVVICDKTAAEIGWK